MTFSEIVNVTGTPQLTLETGATDATAVYTGGTGTNTLTFTYTVGAGEAKRRPRLHRHHCAAPSTGAPSRPAPATSSGSHAAGTRAAGSLGANKNLVIETTAPTLVITPNGTATIANPIVFTFQFSETVSGFVAGDIVVTGGTAGGFTQVDGDTYTLAVTLAGPGRRFGERRGRRGPRCRRRNDNTSGFGFRHRPPTATDHERHLEHHQRRLRPRRGTVSIQVTFDAVVTVTGTPPIDARNRAADAIANYTSGSGTNTLTFTYTVATGQNSPDLDYTSTAAPLLNGGTIQGTLGDNAVFTLPGRREAVGSLGVNKNLVIETTAPTLLITPNGTTTTANPVVFTFQFSEVVSGFLTGDVVVTGGTAGAITQIDGDTFTLAVKATGPGAVAVFVAAGTAQDGAGNGNTAATAAVTVTVPASADLHLRGRGRYRFLAGHALRRHAPPPRCGRSSRSPASTEASRLRRATLITTATRTSSSVPPRRRRTSRSSTEQTGRGTVFLPRVPRLRWRSERCGR